MAARPGEGVFMESLDLRISDVNWGLEPAPSPLNGERAGVRGEKAKSFEFPKVRLMERPSGWGCVDVGQAGLLAHVGSHYSQDGSGVTPKTRYRGL